LKPTTTAAATVWVGKGKVHPDNFAKLIFAGLQLPYFLYIYMYIVPASWHRVRHDISP
jgi:hypothetical protein